MVLKNDDHDKVKLGSRERVLCALRHAEPDRVPVDFLATPEVWDKLVDHFHPDGSGIDSGGFFAPEREAVQQALEIDCRLLSYDVFCNPPTSALLPGAQVDWWKSLARSTPNRMWRQELPDQTALDIWGHHTRTVHNASGSYEEYASWPLRDASSVADLSHFKWPEPDWWDFSTVRDAVQKINPDHRAHMRFRAGTVFEGAWQLRGMEQFMIDMATSPEISAYIMDRMTDVIVENTRRVLETAGDLIDMIYFYDDVGAQENLMISKPMWRRMIRPRHEKIIAVAKSFGKSVLYHCDGAIYGLMNELIDMGIDVLDPIQPNAKDMAPARLKQDFGERLSFHGGIDIVTTLPHGTREQVAAEVSDRVRVMGEQGGYIMSSAHHIQSDTPLENVLEMYRLDLRQR
jgi:uroporphyrinogen decarboxylase